MRQAPRPNLLCCLAGVFASVFALVMMSVFESILEIPCKYLHAASCGTLPDPSFGAWMECGLGRSRLLGVQDLPRLISGDYDRDVMRSMGWL